MNARNSGFTPSRRTLVKGAAWSVPVVAIAQPVMAQDAACSPNSCPPDCLDWSLTGDACRHSVDNHYFFGFCVTNNCPPGTVTPGTTYTLTIHNHTGVQFTDYATGLPATVTITVPEVGNGPICTPGRWYTSSNNASTVHLRLDGVRVSPHIDAPQKSNTCVIPPREGSSSDAKAPAEEESAETTTAKSAPAAPAPAAPAPVEPAPAPADGAAETSTP